MNIELSQVDWLSVLPRIGIDERFLTGKHGPCPICGGVDRFRFDNKEGKGTYYCNQCGSGNGLTLVAKFGSYSFKEAAAAIANVSPVAPVNRPITSYRKEDDVTYKLKKLNAAWNAAKPVTEGDPVFRYLHNRVRYLARLPQAAEIRYHPALDYYERVVNGGKAKNISRGKHPAMLARVRDATGKPVNIHRTYLTADGDKARIIGADGKPLDAKKLMSGRRYMGGGIHLTPILPDNPVLGVGEGIETMLGVDTAYRACLPVWACICAHGLSGFEIPDWVRELHVFADNDPVDGKGINNGLTDAHHLVKRAVAAGFVIKPVGSKPISGEKTIFLHIPKQVGRDFLDVWNDMADLRRVA